MKPKHLAVAVVAATGVAAMIPPALAAGPHGNDAPALAQAKITLVEAIAAAERHAGGKAVKAELERAKGALVFDIEVVKDNGVTDVHVSAADGRILSAQADRPDEDDGNDAED